MKLPVLYVVIPCYNEEQVLPVTSGLFFEKIHALVKAEKISPESRVLFVNDGSKDETWPSSASCLRKTSAVKAFAFLATAANTRSSVGRADDGAVLCRRHHFHRLRRPGRYQRHGRDD